MTGTHDASAGSPAGETPAGEPGRARYLIGSVNPALLAGLAARLEGRVGIRLERVLQTQSGVGGVVIEATPQAIAQLQQELGPDFVVEEDRPLDPLMPQVDPLTPTQQGPVTPIDLGESDVAGDGVVPPGCR